MKKINVLQNNSINSDLCSHCGTCAGICPTKAIKCVNNELMLNEKVCVDCGLCVQCCPANGYEISDLTLEDIKDIPRYSAASIFNEVSDAASSGGFVTQALLTLLKSGKITAAAVVVTGDSLDESCAKFIMADKPEDILRARRSKYTQATVDTVISHILKNEGRYAVVGLPCQLYGLSMAMQKSPILKRSIVYKLGMVCGYTYDEKCINGLLKVMGHERKDVKKIVGWREGGLPGSFSVELKSGEISSLPFADEHSVDVTYFSQNRCDLCKDCLCEYGDVVCADIGGWKERRTLVLTRTDIGNRLLADLKSTGQFLIEKCDIPFEKTVIPFMLREKRAKVDLRILNNKTKAAPIWIGGYTPRLLLSQKIDDFFSSRIKTASRNNRDSHSAVKMKRNGHWSYHKISSLFVMKVIFKLQVYAVKISKFFSSRIKLITGKILRVFKKNSLFSFRKPINSAVIGLGNWGSQYLNFLNYTNYFKPVAAYDSDKIKTDTLCRKYNILSADSIQSLCENNQVEAVFILTSTPTHTEVYDSVRKYKLPVYIEKPVSSDLNSAYYMLNSSKENGNILYVAHSMKYEPCVIKIKEIISSGVLGKIKSFQITRTVKIRKREYFSNEALYQIGVHLIDVFLFLFGLPESVSGHKTLINEYRNLERVVITSSDGVKGTLCYGFSGEFNFHMKIKGEKATMTYADSELKIYNATDVSILKIPMKNEKTVFAELKEFYYSIKENAAYLNTAENAFEVMKICQKIIESGED